MSNPMADSLVAMVKKFGRSFSSKALAAGAVALAISSAQAATTIDAVYFAQTHVHKTTDDYFYLVGNRDVLIKAHVVDPATPAASAVTAVLTLNGQTNTLTLTGPATLPASIADGPGVVQHSFNNSFTTTIPKAWVKPGLSVSVRTGAVQKNYNNLKIGAPTKLIVQMFDIYWWGNSDSADYDAGWDAEFEAKLPVSEMILRRVSNMKFPELVTDVDNGSHPPYRCRSRSDYQAQSGKNTPSEQGTSTKWVYALRDAGGGGRIGLHAINNYGVPAGGGEGGGFIAISNGDGNGVLWHELGHSMSLPHWGDNGAYPYKGAMFGIPAPNVYMGTHAGPVWAFDPILQNFISPTKDGAYRNDPMQGGGEGRQPSGYLVNHFSDYSVNKMRLYLEGQVLVWNSSLNKYASWDQTDEDYTDTVISNGINYPIQRDVSIISLMVSVCGAKPSVNMAYKPTPAYIGNLIRRFDPTVANDRAESGPYSPLNGIDYCLRVTQGGVIKHYMVPASNEPDKNPILNGALVTKAVNVPAADGAVTKVELLDTPNADVNGLPANPQVLYTWPASLIQTPTGLTAVGRNGAVDLDWNASPDATSYRVKRATVSGGPYTTIRTQTGTSYTDTTVTNGTTYFYVVTAVNSEGEGFNSNEASATPPLSYYWDNNGATAGFGTAAGIWAAPTIGNAMQGWSTSTNGSTLPEDVTTSSSADLNFGLTTNGLASGTITVNGTVAAKSLKFAFGSGSIVLSGGTIDLETNATITVAGASDTETIQSVIAGASGSLTKDGAGTLIVSGSNTYAGTTTVAAGTLALGADNVLANNTRVSLGNATLDAATFTDAVATLDVTGAATINLGAGAVLSFGNSSALNWSGGTLNLTGNFVSGLSLRFRTNSSALTPDQLSRISGFGYSSFALNSNGFLVVTPVTTVSSTFSVSTTPVGTSTDSDFHIVENATNTLVNDSTLIAGSPASPNVDHRAYLQFNLTGLLNNSIVTSATLRLWRNVTASDQFGSAVVQRRTAAFVPGGASDYDELVGDMPSATFASLDATNAAWVEVDVTAIVESWRTGNLANHFGFAIQGSEGFGNTGKNFSSRTGANPPELVVIQHDAAAIVPTIANLSPANGATGVAANANLVATFSENITIGTGNITLKNLSDGTQTTIAITNPQVSVSGATLTINPTANLAAGKSYAIRISAAAVKNSANNPFAGIANDTTWNFTTAPTFSSWITGTFAGGASVPVDKRDPDDDPDNDGISNLLEYALAGHDPLVADAPIGAFAPYTLSFTKRPGTSGLTYAIQRSTDLGATDPWTEVTGGTYVNNATNISYTFTPDSVAKNFLRLRVQEN